MPGSASRSSYDPYALAIPSALAVCFAFANWRDAMATISVYLPCCMAGITFFTPIAAVLRTPQRILLGMLALFDESFYLQKEEKQRRARTRCRLSTRAPIDLISGERGRIRT